MPKEENIAVMYKIVGEKNYKFIEKSIEEMDNPKDYNNMHRVYKIVYKELKKKLKDNNLDLELLRMLCRFASFSDTTAEKELLQHGKINYCVNCGWCCSNCNIMIHKNEMIRLMVYGVPREYFVEMGQENMFTYVNKPCLLMNKQKKCEVYPIRPSSCAAFPLTKDKKGNVVVSKIANCRFIIEIVKLKVLAYINYYNELEQQSSVKATLTV